MAEAERIIGTPDTPDDGGEHTAAAGAPAGTGAVGASGQAGASGAGGQGATAGRAGRGRRIAVLFAVAVFAYALDLISKMLVVSRLEGHAPIQVVGDLLELHAIRNPGAAFGFGAAFTVIFTLIAAAVIVVIIRLARKLYSFPWAVALGLLLGGALGNLTDRIFRAPGVFEGEVVDFIAPKGFAVFNLADSAIVCGGILIVLLSFRGLDPDGTVHKD
ncbi:MULTISPECIES: signal peptidase II [Streptomyces]|uniref:Lipoprotein signal peptidase n=2 Tax=Streptomyces TaxID=1883 RepID=A0A101Q9A3_STRCK|nr:signal peptidase II [Streptomyces corchorusii]AEY88825.1 putative signal peptidase II [Streptomyces hygroscopicus subsp. jinggangensis 5008]AGF62983.1 putative signal peptidase II [Streptomyces hygroscopicus subsp. jinggangensis TL01]ALO93262.1 Lipoprotein signal peptidase [Streptomyces hygroscopicus subsp. limoneus]KUN25615.1 signal peptidase II [Streptomyces corchorusii]